ncbi:MAG: PEGA domain-containing protein [Candidatus Xenobia bacterium]
MGRRLAVVLGAALILLVALFWKDTDAPVGHAELTVNSHPQGATVILDGHRIGITPITEAPLAPGAHILSVTLPGYLPVEQTVTLRPGDRRFLELTLSPSPPPRPNQKA